MRPKRLEQVRMMLELLLRLIFALLKSPNRHASKTLLKLLSYEACNGLSTMGNFDNQANSQAFLPRSQRPAGIISAD